MLLGHSNRPFWPDIRSNLARCSRLVVRGIGRSLVKCPNTVTQPIEIAHHRFVSHLVCTVPQGPWIACGFYSSPMNDFNRPDRAGCRSLRSALTSI